MSRTFRVLFLGTPDFAVEPLKALLEDPNFDVVHVVSQPDRPKGRGMQLSMSPVKELATERGLEVTTPEVVSSDENLKFLATLRLDAAVVVAYGQILSQKFLDLFGGKVVNIHSSLLPRWRGAAPMQRAIMTGDTETGVTLQQVVFKLDAGDIIGVKKVPLTEDIDFPILYDQLKVLSRELMTQDLVAYLNGAIVPHPQDSAKVTIAKKLRKEEGLIDWKKSSREIQNAVRGLWPWPGAWTFRNGKMLKIRRVRQASGLATATEPGHVIDVSKESFVVACGEGALEILEVQPESRSLQSSAEYLRGRSLVKGEVFTQNETPKQSSSRK